MKKEINKKFVISLLIPLLGGLLSGLLARGGIGNFDLLKKASLTPPGWVFAVVWPILYLLMGYSSYLIMEENDYHSDCCLKIYYLNLFINFLWSPLFFGLGLRLFSFIWIILLDIVVIYMAICFYKVNKKATYLLIPYLVWLSFATYLNLMFYLLNR